MIAFSALLPASALALVRVGRRDALPLGEIREAALAQLRQFRADLTGSPDTAEHIHRILNSTISA
jgi:hypothetical protein